MMVQFPGFSTADFDAYLERKWASNAFTLERRLVKEKLRALGHLVEVTLSEELGGLELSLTDEFPTLANGKRVSDQWCYFARNAKGRKDLTSLLETISLRPEAIFNVAPQQKHACLAMILDQHVLEIGLRIHHDAWVDRKNLSRKLILEWERETLIHFLRKLPDGYRIGFDGEEGVSVHQVDDPFLERFSSMATDHQGWLRIGLRYCRENSVLASSEFASVAMDQLRPLLPIFRFLSWTRENDLIHVSETLRQKKEERKERARDEAPFGPGDQVTILAGLFAGRSGILQEMDPRGQARVLVGKMAVKVERRELKRCG